MMSEKLPLPELLSTSTGQTRASGATPTTPSALLRAPIVPVDGALGELLQLPRGRAVQIVADQLGQLVPDHPSSVSSSLITEASGARSTDSWVMEMTVGNNSDIPRAFHRGPANS